MELSVLTAPLTAQEVEWRVQSQTKDGQKIIVVPYITNRCVMQRFDEQFGWAGWQNEINEIESGFLCTITVVLPGGEIVRKTDGASRTAVEPVKGGISDAMKRAAVQFGLGRSLYDFPKVLIQTTDKYIPDWASPLLDKMVDKLNAGGIIRDVVVLKPEHAKSAKAV
ncbi:Rad52/Rad22 family DNA repair protein [Spirosoma koreense]